MTMFTEKRKRRILRQIHPDYDTKTQLDAYAVGTCDYADLFQDGKRVADEVVLIAEDAFLSLRADGFPVRLAGRFASRLAAGIRQHPDAAQIVMVVTENGNVSTLPGQSLDFSGGFISGDLLRSAIVFDVRNARARIERAIAADAELVG